MAIGGPQDANVNVGDIDIVAPNFKKRLSGVTSTATVEHRARK